MGQFQKFDKNQEKIIIIFFLLCGSVLLDLWMWVKKLYLKASGYQEIHHVIKERVIKRSKHRAQKSRVHTSLSLKKSHESYQVEAENKRI